MASNLNFDTTLRNDMLDEVTTTIGSSGLLRIYDGTQPADVSTAITSQTLLAELALSTTAAPGASGGVLTFSTITQDSSANASGTATWMSYTTSGGTRKIDGSVGTSDADLVLNSTSIVAGGTVSVTSATITAGNA